MSACANRGPRFSTRLACRISRSARNSCADLYAGKPASAASRRWSLGTTHAGKTHPNAAEKPAVRFKLIALAESLLTGGIQLVQITFQSVFERTADRRLLRGTGEQIEDEYKLALIMFE